MQAKEHKDYIEEKEKLEHTMTWVKGQNDKLQVEERQLNKEIIDLRKEVSSAVDDRLLLKLQMQQMLVDELGKLDHVKVTPYFGRINFEENYTDDLEIIYIGKFGLYDSEVGDMVVLDWRTPMANVYYSGLDEEVSYRTPNGVIEGKIYLKRRYVMEQGELVEIHDEKSLQDNLKDSIQKDTGFLIDSLSKSTSGRLTEIVATIQAQQNRIIRSEAFLPLVVQGVAGSGKTTIALHRMAYLIYNQQDKEARYMVVAPNKLFLNYIAEILPDLGVDNVFQTTFEEWALSKLEKGIELTTEAEKLDTLLNASKEEAKTISLAAKLRGSMVFKKIIDLHLRQLERGLIDRNGILFDGMTVLSFKEVQEVFLVSNKHLPLDQRVVQLGEYIKKRLKDKESTIKNYIEGLYQSKINTLKASVDNIEEVRSQIIELYNERDLKLKEVKKWIVAYVKNYISAIEVPTAEEIYFNIFKEEEILCKLLEKQISKEELEEVIALLNENFKQGKIESEDLGPLVYIQMQLYGIKEEKKYSHIVVDESQDLDEMKLVVLREISLNDSFTLVGDLSQGIYAYKGITNWERMMERVFINKKYNYYEMTTSYRSTIEIIDLANKVISSAKEFTPLMAEPVLRHGSKPQLIRVKDEKERIQKIIEAVKGFESQGMVSICILTKNQGEAKKVYESLKEEGQELQLISTDGDEYKGKVAVMTGYISKGLEFDAVLIYDVSKDTFEMTTLHTKLLYVMITRALHYLNMYTMGEEIELLDGCKQVEISL